MKNKLCLFLAVLMLLTIVPFSSADENVLTVASTTETNGAFFTTQFGNNTSDIDVREMLHGYNPIVWTSQLAFETDPMVVASMDETISATGKTYTFFLKTDMYWNDGTRISAKDFVFSYALLTSSAFKAIGGDTDVWQHIVGYEQYNSGKTNYLSGIRLLSDFSFSVTVKKEYLPYFYEYSYLSVTPCPIDVIAPDCVVADDGRGVFLKNKNGTKSSPVFTADLLKETILNKESGYLSHPYKTCGAYSLVSYDDETGTVVFSANPWYKGNNEGYKPSVQRVRLIHAAPQDIPVLLQTGEVDIVNKAVSRELIESCGNISSGIAFENYPRMGYSCIALSCEQGPQQFLKVRQAIAYAFDTDLFVRNYLGPYGMAVYGYYGLGQWMTQATMGTIRLDEMTEEQVSEWDALNLDRLNYYSYQPQTALKLLIDDGWTLNEKGKSFEAGKDRLRYKRTREGLMPLSFHFGLTENNPAANMVLTMLKEDLEPLGAEIIVTEDSFANILNDYLRENGSRKYDMSFLAYNFNSVFDPLIEVYSQKRNVIGSQNAMGIVDNDLLRLAEKLHHTNPEDVIGFLKNWVAFQQRYNEILPSIPLYSGVYYDFYPATIKDYHPAEETNWPRALMKAHY